MRWIDRFILLLVGGGLWALTAAYVLGDDGALEAVENRCTVHGSVTMYRGGNHGNIDAGYLSCLDE